MNIGGLHDDIQQVADDHTDIVFEREIQRIAELLFSLYIICIIIPDLKLKDIIWIYCTVEVHYEYIMRCSIQLEVPTICNHE